MPNEGKVIDEIDELIATELDEHGVSCVNDIGMDYRCSWVALVGMLLDTEVEKFKRRKRFDIYSFNHSISQLLVTIIPDTVMTIPDGFVELGYIDDDGGPAVDSSND